MTIKIRKGFVAKNPNWVELSHQKYKKKLITAYMQSIIEMRIHQLEVFNKHRNDRYLIIRKPPGAGKSGDIKFVFTLMLNEDPNLKLLISIPQHMIGSSFRKDTLRYPDGTVLEWMLAPLNDLTYGKYLSKVKEIKKFLRKKRFNKGIHERIMLCSHAALVRACEEMSNISWDNTAVVIDEAHHIEGSAEEDIALNGLGRVVKSILRSKSPTSRLWFTTATYFRSDGVDILSEEDENKFNTYFLPLSKHFETLKYIKSYSYDFVPYSGEFPEEEIIYSLKKHKNKKILFYVPGIGRLWAGRNKGKTVKKLKNVILKAIKNANIIDLVMENGRDKRKEYLEKNKYNSDIDVVLSVALFNEGTDWPEAEVVIDLAPTNSLRIANQRFGRLLRDHPRKKDIYYYTFFPFCLDFNDTEKCRQQLSKNFAVLTASFMLEESIVPVKLPKKKTGKKGERRTRETINYFQKEVPNKMERDDIRKVVHESLLQLRAEDKIISSKEYKKNIREALKDSGVEQNVEKIADEIELELTRRVMQDFDTNIEWIVDAGFDKIKWEKITDYICQFVSGKHGKRTLKEFNEYFDKQPKTPEEWVKIAEELALANAEGRLGEYEIE